MTIDDLRQVPLFESLDDEAAKKLCELLETLDCEAQKILFRAGDAGDAMYIIERGKVRISVQATDGRELTLTELGRGEITAGCSLARAFSFVYAEQSQCRSGNAHRACQPVAAHRRAFAS